MEPELNQKKAKALFRATANFQTEEECKKFCRDLCTLSEFMAMAERRQVAKQVEKGISYRNISEKTGVNTATITRVAHWLHHGMGGYRLMLGRVS